MKHKPSASDSTAVPEPHSFPRTAPSPKRVLLVDDDWDLLVPMAEYIRHQGFEVSMAANGSEALKLFRKGRFELVVTDLQMPVLDGRQLLEEIKTLSRPTPVVVITGQSAAQLEQAGGISGADDVLRKPFSLEQLANVLERQLYSRDAFERADSSGGVRHDLPADR